MSFSDLPDAVLEHIKSCPTCSREAKAIQLLNQSIRRERVADVSGVVSLQSMRDSLEQRESVRWQSGRENRRWRPAIGVAAALLVLVAALWPRQEAEIVGYEVMVSGMEREYIEDSDQMCDLLMNLGLSDADIHHLGCDSTCRFHIVLLKTESEARLVAGAVSRMQTGEIETSIRPVTDNRQGPNLL
ncbi:MAG: hypothetical protein P1R58_00670 [bacterium]|nr:hypothetical protein [bacterium]